MERQLENGYVLKTTFWDDFCIADVFGESSIQDTFNRAFKEWKNNLEYVTELAMIMSWQSCYWWIRNDKYSKLYSDLYHKVDDWCLDNLRGDALTYYLKTTD